MAGIPDGWPEDVDGEEYISDQIEARTTSFMEAKFGRTQATDQKAEIADSPSVQRLKEMIG